MAPDSGPKPFIEETLAATDRTGGDKTEILSAQRAVHSAFGLGSKPGPDGRLPRSEDDWWAEALQVCRDRSRSSDTADAAAVVIETEASVTVVI